MDYDQFRIEDFIIDQSFQQYCLGTNEEAVKFWTNWKASHPQKATELEKAKALYLLLNGSNDAESFKKHESFFVKKLQQEGIELNQSSPAKIVTLAARPRRTTRLLRISVAAAVILLLAATAIFFLTPGEKSGIAKQGLPKPAPDPLPGGDKAVLTLANGQTIILDTAANGTITQQGGMKVIKLNGQLAYEQENKQAEVLYNTITTPKGGQYQLELADGSKVWLNAASSLRFPTAFVGKDRMVELKGEAYFEVAHNENMPFHVMVNDVDVKVLGTQFNINSYDDEEDLRTTLVQGSVLVSATNLKRALVLKPGQQAVVDAEQLSVNKDVDINEVIAWKNGKFSFNATRLDHIMRQIARWYDLEVEFEGQQQDRKFSGIVDRDSKLSEVLKIMKQAGVRFEIEEKKIKVLK